MSLEKLNVLVNSVVALGTLAAVGVAVIVAIRESRRANRADQRADRADARAAKADAARDAERARQDAERARQDAERAEAIAAEQVERHRSQALQVIAWVFHTDASDLTGRQPGDPSIVDWTYHIAVENHSSAPVFEVSVDLMNGRTKSFEEFGRVMRPVMTPNSSIEVALGKVLPERALACVRFRDLQGVWWRRFETGLLEETNQDGAVLPPVPRLRN